jgi:hypothetical protein
VIAALLLALFAVADEPPLVGRPPNFSGIVGRFRIEADIDPKSVTVEDPLTLRVTIHGQAVTTPPTRGNLRLFPKLEDFDFFVEDGAEEDRADPATGTWTFVWRLRPKTTDVREVPPLPLVYWSPMLQRYQAATADALPIEVRPREAVTPPVVEVPLDVRFLTPIPDDSQGVDASWISQFVLWGGVLVASIALVLWGSRREPKAASAASEVLPMLDLDADEALLRYLQLRFALRAEPTPAEIDRALKRHGISPETRGSWTAWQRERDARRFGASSAGATGGRDEARRLILAAEAETCRR